MLKDNIKWIAIKIIIIIEWVIKNIWKGSQIRLMSNQVGINERER